MNKINIYILLLLVLVSTACDDQLELTPYDGLSDEQLFSSADGFQNAMLGVYGGFRANGYYGEDRGIMICPDILSDNLSFNMSGRQTQRPLFEWRNTAVDESFEMYKRGYKIISRANRILDNIDKLPDGDLKNTIKGEALAVRGLVHFDIARVYCKIPTQSADAENSLGIYYMESFDPATTVRRVGTTVKGVYDKAIKDLEDAAKIIPATNADGRLNKVAVHGLLAKVYLHYGNWDKVIENADLVTGAKVVPYADFGKVWLDEYTDNVLFKIRVTDQDNHRPGVPYNQEADGEIRSEYVCSFELRQLFKSGNGDVRLGTATDLGEFKKDLYSHVIKYLGRTTGDKTVIDGKYLRYEEVLLSKAEAQYKKGGLETEALATLDLVRAERYSSFVGGESGAALLDAIQLERRLELAFEGDRFFQLKRLGQALTRTSDGEKVIENIDGTESSAGTAPVVTSVAASDHRWQLPIPQGAFDSNSNLTNEDQNPGY